MHAWNGTGWVLPSPNVWSRRNTLPRVALRHLGRLPNVSLRHVKGHQTDDVRYEDLPFEAQLNEDCDKEAQSCMRGMVLDGSRPPPTAEAGAMLYLDNYLFTTKMEDQIQYEAHVNCLCEYVKQKYEWTDGDIDSVNWKAAGLAKNRLKMNDNVHISKIMYKWLNVGKKK